MDRDPRTDPRPGDVVEFWKGTRREVTRLGPTTVHYKIGNVLSSMTKRQWVSMCGAATIISRGPDD